MQIPDEIRLAIEGVGILGSGAVIMWRLGRLSERFDNTGLSIKELKTTVNKMGETLQAVAVQKDQIQGIREQQMQTIKRTDETFSRVFAVLDRLQDGRRLS